MYKKLLFILFFSLPIILFAQTIEYFGDTVDFKPGRRSVNAEIRLRNATRNITGGALVNKGGGLLAFRKVLTKVNDSTYLILDDTLHLPTFITSVVQAVSADWNTLVNKPNLAPVAISNDYNDLVNKPSFTGTGDTIINNYDSIVIHNDTTINNYYGNAPPDTISINVVRDFGFVPDGVTDNYNQSIALRNFINARHGYAEIIYPQGRYYINQYRKSQPIYDSTIVLNDPEDTSATAKADTTITQVGYTPNGIQNFNYIDCNALTIRGIGGVEIVLNGAFDRAVTRTDAQGRKYSDYNTVIPLSFTRCNNVNIFNINILGGNQYMTENDPAVFEGDGHCLVIKSSSHFIVQNVNIYNIETDAVYIETTSTDYKASHDLSFSNCIWSHAGRQACTVGSAYDVYFNQVQFISTRDTTGGAMGNYPGNAPGKGVDIEPNFSPFGKMKGIWTQNINFNNCIFKDNRGGSIAFSLADRIRGINIINTEFNDTLYNHKYAMITGVLDVLVKDCHIYTGTGQLYPVWHFGTAQRGKWINNYIETGSEGFVVATKAQFGLILDGNTIVGKHDSTWHGYFPSINGPCTYTNNKHFIDAPLYAGNSTRLGIIQGATTSAGNFFYSEKDSSFSDYYHINYASTKTVERDFFNLDDAIRPLNEDAFFTDGTPFFSAGAHGQGSVQEYNVIGNKKLKQYWLNDLPVTGIYNIGDRIQMINPLAAGGIDHYTVRIGGNAVLGQVQYDTSFTGRPASNGGSVDLTNYYSKSQSDARYATVASLNPYLLSTDAAATYKPLAYVPTWSEITGKPTFSTVATSGDYNDLINKPTNGTNTLASVTAAGNSTATASYFTDSADITKAAIHNALAVGDTTTYQTDSIYFIGHSIMYGVGASAGITGRWSYKYAQNEGAYEWNVAIGNTTLVPLSAGDSSGFERLYIIPTYRPTIRYIMIMYETNDVGRGTVSLATYTQYYRQFIDTLIARGYPKNRIVICTAPYSSASFYHTPVVNNLTNFTRAAIQVAKEKGVQYIDNYMDTKPYGNNLMYTDSIHPNDNGYYEIYQNTLRSLGGNVMAEGMQFKRFFQAGANGQMRGNFPWNGTGSTGQYLTIKSSTTPAYIGYNNGNAEMVISADSRLGLGAGINVATASSTNVSLLITASNITANNTIILPSGTTSKAPINFPNFTALRTSPISGDFERDASRLYFTNSSVVRKGIAFLDDTTTYFATKTDIAATNATVASQTIAIAGKQDAITLTTTGTSGAATLTGSTLNIPQYAGGSTTITNNLTTSTTGTPLDAAQGKVLKDLVDINTTNISTNTTRTALNLGAMTTTARDAISSPAVGSQIFNTTNGYPEYYDSFWGWMPMSANNDWKKKYGIDYYNEFLSGASDGQLTAFSANSAVVGAATIITEQSNILSLALTTTATARAGTMASGGAILLGTGASVFESRVQVPLLSTSTDRFQFLAGFIDNQSAADQTDGVYFLYDEGGASTGSAASANWQIVTDSSNTRTFTTTSTTVTAGTWYTLRAEVNAAGTSATFYINGTSVGTVTINIPKGTSRQTSFGAMAVKSVGTSSRNLYVDYISLKQKFTTSR